MAIPTETVYGLAANALDINAVIKVFETKQRPRFNPLIVHIKSIDEINKYCKNVPEIVFKIAEKYSPGPITYLLEKKDIIDDIITAGSSLVAVRIPNHKLTLELLNILDFPLVAPSANPFGYISPTSAKHVLDNLNGKIEYILDGGNSEVGIESTIIGFGKIDKIENKDNDDKIIIYRKGSFDIEKLREFANEIMFKVEINEETNNESQNNRELDSPGRLKAHYSPNTKCILGDIPENYNQAIMVNPKIKIAILSFDKEYSLNNNIISNKVLSSNSNLTEAAKNLFSYLRELENENVDLILLEKVPDVSIGQAINDRLEKAAAKYI